MELDELKTLINQKLATEHAERSAEDIRNLLNRRTASVIDKLKRSLWIEIICCIIGIVLFAGISIMSHYHSLRIYFSVFTILAGIFLGIVIHLLRKTQRLSASALPVKSNLQTITALIREFNKRYFQFTMALLPVCFAFAFILGYTDKEKIDMPVLDQLIIPHLKSGWNVIVFLLLYLGGLSVALYYFTKWYLRKLYGRYVDQLTECMAELED